MLSSFKFLASLVILKEEWLHDRDNVLLGVMLPLQDARNKNSPQEFFLNVQALNSADKVCKCYQAFQREDVQRLFDKLFSNDIVKLRIKIVRVDDEEMFVRELHEHYYHVDEILAHRYVGKNKRMEFLVQWLGFEENSWLSLHSTLRRTNQLHLYLIELGMEKKIPKEFRHHYNFD